MFRVGPGKTWYVFSYSSSHESLHDPCNKRGPLKHQRQGYLKDSHYPVPSYLFFSYSSVVNHH